MKYLTLFLLLLFFVVSPAEAKVLSPAAGIVTGHVSHPLSEMGLSRLGDKNTAQGLGWDVASPNNNKNHASVWLVSEDLPRRTLTDQEIDDWYKKGLAPKDQPIYITETDRRGAYRFENIPAGSYFAIVLDSQESIGEESSASLDALKKVLPAWEKFELYAVGIKGLSVERVTVK